MINPSKSKVRLLLCGVPLNLQNDTIRAHHQLYGEVQKIVREIGRVPDFALVETATRIVRVLLKGSITMEQLPHQVSLYAPMELGVVPGRPPLCNRRKRKGLV